jgi:hypothetical protein
MDTIKKPQTDTSEIIEGTVVEPAKEETNKKKEIVKIAAIVGTTVLFHVGCALIVRKLNKSATPSITTI